MPKKGYFVTIVVLTYRENNFSSVIWIFPGYWGAKKWIEKEFCKSRPKSKDLRCFWDLLVKGQNNYCNRIIFWLSWTFQLGKIEKNNCSTWKNEKKYILNTINSFVGSEQPKFRESPNIFLGARVVYLLINYQFY